jgi:hypothetical protein
MRILNFATFAVSGLLLLACQSENQTDKTISTDLIGNTASASAEKASVDAPVFNFQSDLFDFGEITQGEQVSHSFEFENTGTSDLIISTASGSCGCTVPSYPKNPIAPGQKANIDVVFNSEGKEGKQEKTVTIMANTNPAATVLKIKGNVITPLSKN